MLATHPKSIFLCIGLAVAVVGCTPQNPANALASSQPTQSKRQDIRDMAGIELGKDIVIPECRKEKAYGMILYAMEEVSYPCFKDSRGARGTIKTEPDLPRGKEHNGIQTVELGAASVPAGVSSTATLLMIDGKPEEVRLMTEGVEVQERLYALLLAKYGSPGQSNVSQLQNAMGAHYQGLEAAWQLPAITVRFIGLLDNPREGLISATTPKGTQFISERQEKSSDTF